jgi:hypothetical protein
MSCPEGWMSAFDDKTVVGKLQFVASKQTFNFDDDQDRNAAKPVGRQCPVSGKAVP